MSLANSSTPFLTAAMPTSAAAKSILVASTIACMVYIIRVTSPAHLTRVLVSSLAAAEHALLHTVESGTFRSEYAVLVLAKYEYDTANGHYAVLAEQLTSLQLDVSLLREASLCDALSYWATISQFLNFRRTLAILRCIQEVRTLETDIEILKEFQLRELPLEASTAAAARTISMRRRLQI
ncbi:hypothetical protein B0H11DRAFT_2216796 [Mycena galericulata]|nr:hypothetical protein B0H11DRAFT_2216796 [Mycena galericulata]